MVTFKDDILITLFGGGIADYSMLESCNYDFSDVLIRMLSYTTLENADFTDILTGAFELYKDNIYDVIQDKIESYKRTGDMEAVEKLKSLDVYNDIESDTNYLCCDIFICDSDVKAIYRELLEKEIEAENDKIGFVALDLYSE